MAVHSVLAGMVILRGLFVHKVRRKSQNWLFMPSAQPWPPASSESEVLVLCVWTVYPVNWPARVGEVKLIAGFALFWQVKKSLQITIPMPSAARTQFPCFRALTSEAASGHAELQLCSVGIYVLVKYLSLREIWIVTGLHVKGQEPVLVGGGRVHTVWSLPAWVSLGSCWDPLSWLSLKEEEVVALAVQSVVSRTFSFFSGTLRNTHTTNCPGLSPGRSGKLCACSLQKKDVLRVWFTALKSDA